MARQINETLELEKENERYVETLYLLKTELREFRREYTEGINDQMVSELETLCLAIENALIGI
jgi:hypothetical protein